MRSGVGFQGPNFDYRGPFGSPVMPDRLISWRHLWWAQGYSARVGFALAGAADGQPVSTWVAEKGTNLAQATSALQPLYRATGGVAGTECLEGRGVSDGIMECAFTAVPQPFSIVLIGAFPADPGADKEICDGDSAAARVRYESSAGGSVQLAGSVTYQGPAFGTVTAPKLITGVFNSTASFAEINGTRSAVGDAGTNTLQGFSMFGIRTGGANISQWRANLVGVYAGDVTADDNWETFLQWVESFYLFQVGI